MYTHKEAHLHPDLPALQNTLYALLGFEYSQAIPQPESQEYGAASYIVNEHWVEFRSAKITPKKPGHFVAIWKRRGKGPTEPYDESDKLDFLIISVRKESYFGHFVFPKPLLVENHIFSKKGEGGKRGIRVYAPWEDTLNKQAKKTQAWQARYFIDLSEGTNINEEHGRALYTQFMV